jgi:hypothetical protein
VSVILPFINAGKKNDSMLLFGRLSFSLGFESDDENDGSRPVYYKAWNRFDQALDDIDASQPAAQ